MEKDEFNRILVYDLYVTQELETKTNPLESEEKETCEQIIRDTNVSSLSNFIFNLTSE